MVTAGYGPGSSSGILTGFALDLALAARSVLIGAGADEAERDPLDLYTRTSSAVGAIRRSRRYSRRVCSPDYAYFVVLVDLDGYRLGVVEKKSTDQPACDDVRQLGGHETCHAGGRGVPARPGQAAVREAIAAGQACASPPPVTPSRRAVTHDGVVMSSRVSHGDDLTSTRRAACDCAAGDDGRGVRRPAVGGRARARQPGRHRHPGDRGRDRDRHARLGHRACRASRPRCGRAASSTAAARSSRSTRRSRSSCAPRRSRRHARRDDQPELEVVPAYRLSERIEHRPSATSSPTGTSCSPATGTSRSSGCRARPRPSSTGSPPRPGAG